MRLSDLISNIFESKKSKNRPEPNVAEPVKILKPVAVEKCPLFESSYIDKVKSNRVLQNKLIEFLIKKTKDPLTPVGNDRPLTSKGVYASAMPGIWHAHLNLDISVWYVYVGGVKPAIRLYGLFTHDETGTGPTPKIQKQKTMATKMANQTEFTPFPLPS